MKRRWIKTAYMIFLIILVINQSRVLSGWFYNDYLRYQRDKEIVIDISHSIEKQMDETKPVVFIGEIEMPPNVNRIEGGVNGLSFITHYADYRTERNRFGYLLHDFIELQGHTFKVANDDQYEEAIIIAEGMLNYPVEGSILEKEEFIIVNFD